LPIAFHFEHQTLLPVYPEAIHISIHSLITYGLWYMVGVKSEMQLAVSLRLHWRATPHTNCYSYSSTEL